MLPQTNPKKHRKKLLVAVALASGVTLECSAAGIGLFDSGLGCESNVAFSSSCRIIDVTTTCGVSVTCDNDDASPYTTCTLPTPSSDCNVTVSFENGSQQIVPVSVYSHGADCGAAGVFGIGLPLQCEEGDGGFGDAGDAMIDAVDDTVSDDAATD